MYRFIFAFGFSLLVGITGALCSGQEPDWKIGLARVKITPPQPVYMAGYASRNKPYESIHDDLYVKALVIEDKSGNRAALVTSDLIGFTAEISKSILERIAKKTGISAKAVIT